MIDPHWQVRVTVRCHDEWKAQRVARHLRTKITDRHNGRSIVEKRFIDVAVNFRLPNDRDALSAGAWALAEVHRHWPPDMPKNSGYLTTRVVYNRARA